MHNFFLIISATTVIKAHLESTTLKSVSGLTKPLRQGKLQLLNAKVEKIKHKKHVMLSFFYFQVITVC